MLWQLSVVRAKMSVIVIRCYHGQYENLTTHQVNGSYKHTWSKEENVGQAKSKAKKYGSWNLIIPTDYKEQYDIVFRK